MVIALSPVPMVVSLVLLVHHERPYVSSIAYVAGRLASLGVLTTAFMHVPRLFDVLRSPGPPWADWAVMVAGAVVVALGVRVWWRRARTADASRWDSKVGRVTPLVAASMGLFPMLANPKVLAASAAVGTQIASARFTGASAVIAVAYYALLANSTVAAPILAYVVVGPGIDQRLERLRGWIQDRHRAITALTLVIVGIAVVLYGVS
nr:GAP family protein [Mycobacterium mantenii]